MNFSEATENRELLLSERAKGLVDGTVPVTSLDLNIPEDAADFEAAVAVAPRAVLDQLTLDDIAAQEILYAWVKSSSSNILKLNPDQYFPEIMELYFYDRMVMTAPADKSLCSFSLHKSVDGYYCLNVNYVTHAGEEIRYMDSQLKMPVVMSSRLQVRLKVYDMMKFMNAMDISLNMLSYRQVERYVSDLIVNAYRSVMMILLDKRQVGYYSLNRYYKNIADTVTMLFDNDYDRRGILISDFQIREISIPKNTVDSMERQCFAYRKLEQKFEHDLRCEKMALDMYERKAEIHGKYPNFPVGMTEAEKDFALERYMKKMGLYEEPVLDFGDEDKVVVADAATETTDVFDALPEKPVAPHKPEEPVLSVRKYGEPTGIISWILFIILGAASVAMFFFGDRIAALGNFLGYAAVAVSVLIFGLYRAHATVVKYKRKENAPAVATYKENLAKYEQDMVTYEAQHADFLEAENRYQNELSALEAKRKEMTGRTETHTDTSADTNTDTATDENN